jgi:hypothetical protein
VHVSRFPGIQAIVDLSYVLKEVDKLPLEEQFKQLKQELFKGRDIEKVPYEEVCTKIINLLKGFHSTPNELIAEEALPLETIKNLNDLKSFFERYFASHTELDKDISDNVIVGYTEVLTKIVEFSKTKWEPSKPAEAIAVDQVEEKAIEVLRESSEEIQTVTNFEEVLSITQKAEKANSNLSAVSKELKDRVDNFNLAIQEKVHSFLRKEVTKMNSQLKENKDETKKKDLKGRLQKYDTLADLTGFHKKNIKDQINDLFRKI